MAEDMDDLAFLESMMAEVDSAVEKDLEAVFKAEEEALMNEFANDPEMLADLQAAKAQDALKQNIIANREKLRAKKEAYVFSFNVPVSSCQ